MKNMSKKDLAFLALVMGARPGPETDTMIAERLEVPDLFYSSSLEAARSLLDDRVYFWDVARRKNKPGSDKPNPCNGTALFVAHVGRHDAGRALALATGNADTPAHALTIAALRVLL